MADAQDSGRLGRIAVIFGLFAAIATVVGVGWTIFSRPDTSVHDYQAVVVATCGQVQALTTAKHNEVFIVGGKEVRVDKGMYLKLMSNVRTQAGIAFDELNARPVPPTLASQHDAAVKAQTAWLSSLQADMDQINRKLPAKPTFDQFNALGVSMAGSQEFETRLNSAMTALAEGDCRVTPPA